LVSIFPFGLNDNIRGVGNISKLVQENDMSRSKYKFIKIIPTYKRHFHNKNKCNSQQDYAFCKDKSIQLARLHKIADLRQHMYNSQRKHIVKVNKEILLDNGILTSTQKLNIFACIAMSKPHEDNTLINHKRKKLYFKIPFSHN
jgi:sulfur carrier protein ThiS